MSGGFDPHLSEIIRRRFNIEGDSGPDDFSPSIVGIVPLDCDSASPEYSYYAKEFRAICWGFVAGEAAEFSYFHIQNPAGSNILAIIKRIWGSSNNTFAFAPVGVYRDDAAPGVGGAMHCATDARWGVAPRGGNSVISQGTDPDITGQIHFTPRVTVRAGTAQDFDWQGDYVLSPGTGLTVWTSTMDTDVDINIELRERMRTRWEE